MPEPLLEMISGFKETENRVALIQSKRKKNAR